MIEVGNFITYKQLHMAVVAVNEDKGKIYALCYENHKLATFDIDDPNAIVVKDKGCPSLVRAIYDDMSRFIQEGR